MLKEVLVEDLVKYIDPLKIKKNPAIALASDGNKTNGLTIGWLSYGILWSKYMATAYVHKARYSKHIFDGAQYYAVCYLKPEHKDVLGYFGRVSGRDEDKMKNCGLEVVTTDVAPYFADSNIVVLCKMAGMSDFDVNHVHADVQDWYNKDGVHTQYYGEIVKVLVNE